MARRWLLGGMLVVLVSAAAHAQSATTRVSIGPGNVQANGDSFSPVLSADGRWIAFQSEASNLVAGDTNGLQDVFVRDQLTGTTTRVSIGPGGVQANATCWNAAISADGRWVAFESQASNLVAGDTNGAYDVFVHDRQAGVTTRASVGSGGTQASLSSFGAALSGDGRWLAFYSWDDTLVPGDTNGQDDVFVRDLQAGTTTRVSVASGGQQGNSRSRTPAISADGRVVAFYSWANNLVAGDTNNADDVFVHDRQNGVTTRVSVGPGGAESNGDSLTPALSADGRVVTFESVATNLVTGDTNGAPDVFAHDRLTGTTMRVSVAPGGADANGFSEYSAVSADGRFVTFHSGASNLVAGDTNGRADAFLFDRQTATTVRVSVASGGTEGNSESSWPVISADGRWVVFHALASNLVTGDTNGDWDVFAHDRGSPAPPSAPEGLAATVVGNLLTLRWTMPSQGTPATNFILEGGLNPSEVLASVSTGSASPVFSFAAPTGSFYLRMYALNGVARSAVSNEIRVHIGVLMPPSAPANLLALVHGDALTLVWSNTYDGGAPTNLVLMVSGAVNGSLPLGLTTGFSVAGVPPGTYTLAVAATNASGTSAPSNTVTVTFPTACSGAPQPPTNFVAYNEGRALVLRWDPPLSGAAPTAYVIRATGTFAATVTTPLTALVAVVPPGDFVLDVAAVNPCGLSAATPSRTVVVR